LKGGARSSSRPRMATMLMTWSRGSIGPSMWT
jgi:hypothetical protein